MSIDQITSYDTRLDYLRHRQEYIGGADAAAILGMSPYPDATRHQTYLKKTLPVEEIDEIDNVHIRRGNFMEKVAEQMASGEAPWLDEEDAIDPTVEPGDHMRHPTMDFIGGTPDLVSPTRIYEVKAPNTGNVDRIKKNGLFDYYWVQGEHYRLITGKPVSFLIVDYNGWDLYRIDPPTMDKEQQDRMVEEYKRFWAMVQEGTPPKETDLPAVNIAPAKGGPELDEMLEEYHTKHEKSKRLDRERKSIKGKILTRTQGADALETENYRMQRHKQSRGDSEWTVLKVSEKDA